MRWLWVLSFAALLAGACGSAGEGADSGSDQPDTDTGAVDAGSEAPDAGSADSGDSEPADSDTSSEAGGDESAPAAVSGDVDCEQITAAVNASGDLVGGDPTLSGEGDLEQQFEEARATMLALKEQAPEIADEIDQMLAGFDAIGAAFAEVGWDTDFAANPAAAIAFSQAAFSDPAVAGMLTSAASIGVWLASNCS